MLLGMAITCAACGMGKGDASKEGTNENGSSIVADTGASSDNEAAGDSENIRNL